MLRIGLATSYRPARLPEPRALLDQALELGADGLGLDAALPSGLLAELMPALKKRRGELPILAMRRGGPPFVGALDKDERREATKRLTADIAICAELDCPIVIPLGRVGPPALWCELGVAFVRDGDTSEVLKRLMAARVHGVERALVAARLGLEALLKVADAAGVKVGILPRARPDELPNARELADLLHDFAGAPLHYWHDTARCYLDALMTGREGAFETARATALGQDVADACGLLAPLVPGTGEATLSFARPVTLPSVVRCDSRATPIEVRAGITWVRNPSPLARGLHSPS